jgi:hypothetical protein
MREWLLGLVPVALLIDVVIAKYRRTDAVRHPDPRPGIDCGVTADPA